MTRYAIQLAVVEVDERGKTLQPPRMVITSTHASSDDGMMMRYWSQLTEQVDDYFRTTQFILGPQAAISERVPWPATSDPDDTPNYQEEP